MKKATIILLTCSPIFAFAGEAQNDTPTLGLDGLWVLFSAALVFFMQAGFKALEVGLVRVQHIETVAMKNVIDWVMVSLSFFFVGFGLMFGESAGGYLGKNYFFESDFEGQNGAGLGFIFFLFQMGFIGTALTIISGAMSERMGFVPYLTGSLLVASIVYPIFGHWAWASLFIPENTGWLEDLGFIDFAGSTVVHSIGAWVSLAGLILVGPRLGRFNAIGEAVDFKPANLSYSVLGLLILWLGWWGFNGGSTLSFNASVGKIIANTNIAGAAGAISAFYHARYLQKGKDIYGKIIGGALGGLVAITASPHLQTMFTSLLIGLIAGVVHNWSYEWLLKKKIDDAVGAIPVHGFCGATGTLLVVIAPDVIFNENGTFDAFHWISQLGTQLVGILMCFFWAFGAGYVVFLILKKTVGLRVSPQEERTGFSLFHQKEETISKEELDEQELAKLLKDLNF